MFMARDRRVTRAGPALVTQFFFSVLCKFCFYDQQYHLYCILFRFKKEIIFLENLLETSSPVDCITKQTEQAWVEYVVCRVTKWLAPVSRMYRRRGYRLFRPRYDWTMIRDQVGETAYGNAYLEIEVKNPRTHIENEKAQYTDYEIELKTNHPVFPLFHSRVRRRYSEFVWLRNKLGLDDAVMLHAPRLPRKQLIGRFKDSFLQKRQQGLERFLNRLASINVFANNPAMLVFLQTSLSKHQMDYYLKTRTPSGIRSLVLRLHDKKLKMEQEHRRPRTRTFSAEYPSTEKSQTLKCQSYGKGWSSYHSDDLFGFGGCDRSDVDIPTSRDMKRCRTISCTAYPGGLLTLPTIPGSSEDGLESMGSTSATEPESQIEEHPLSRSWHGTPRDEIDLVLEDYEIIPFDSIAQTGIDGDDSDEFFDMDLGYVDVNPDMESGREHRFDY